MSLLDRMGTTAVVRVPVIALEATPPPPTRLRDLIAAPRGETRELLQRALEAAPDGLPCGPYRVTALLGAGGSGCVCRARQIATGQDVALKLQPLDRSSRSRGAGYRQEVAATVRLEHPNIARLYEAGQADGVLYLALELVDGLTLAQHVRRHGPLAPGTAARALAACARGLAHAHERGVVHRDIKPSNIMLPGHGGPDPTPAKLVDFGIARLRGRVPEDPSTIECPSGATAGTPAFMAPEQIGDFHGADVRSDLYSLGCSFYFALTGASPFQADEPERSLALQLSHEPCAVQELAPHVSDGLAAVVRRLMAKSPGARYQTPEQLIVALCDLDACGERTPTAAWDAPHQTPPTPDEGGAPLAELWGRWCSVVAACALGAPPGVDADVYKSLHGCLVRALRDAGRARGRMLAVVEPWVTLRSLEKLEWHLLLDLLNTCTRLDRGFRSECRPAPTWRTAARAVLVGAGCGLTLALILFARAF